MQPRGWPVVLSLVMALTPSVWAQRFDDPDVLHWIRLLESHRPGTLDEPALEVSQWPWSKLQPVLEDIAAEGTALIILRSAALLTDIAAAVPVEQRPRASLSGRTLLAEDGKPLGSGILDSHLAAGRSLLERLGSDPTAPSHTAEQAHVIAWYRAVSALLASRHNLADWQPHVIRSLARFPEHAGILFDAGCFHETFAAPGMQAALPRERRPSSQNAAALRQGYRRSAAGLRTDAEKYFRRALARDPSFAEARVRLGRLLTLRDRPEEAARELQQAMRLPVNPGTPLPPELRPPADHTVKYYGWLFLGDTLARLGRTADAMVALQSAAALFPKAQSPRLAISQLAGDQGNLTQAREAVERLLAETKAPPEPSDPWWIYSRGRGRDAESIYAAFSARVDALPAASTKTWRKR